MSDRGSLENLKQEIVENIYTNENQAVTGDLLQDVLIDAVDTMGVSVSQNTSTGHTDINVGGTAYPVASVEEVSQLGQTISPRIKTINLQFTEEGWYYSSTDAIGGNVTFTPNSSLYSLKIDITKCGLVVGDIVEYFGRGHASEGYYDIIFADANDIVTRLYSARVEEIHKITIEQGDRYLYINCDSLVVQYDEPFVKYTNFFDGSTYDLGGSFEDAVNSGASIIKGEYTLTSPITLKDRQIYGDGCSVVVSSSGVINILSNAGIHNIKFDGGWDINRTPYTSQRYRECGINPSLTIEDIQALNNPQNWEQLGNKYIITIGNDLQPNDCQNTVVDGCVFVNFDGVCIWVSSGSHQTSNQPIITNCLFSACKTAIVHVGEFVRYSDLVIDNCYYGFFQRNGNLNITNSFFKRCDCAMYVADTGGGLHSQMSNCQFAHNMIVGLYINVSESHKNLGYIISSSQFADASIEGESVYSIMFNGCRLETWFRFAAGGLNSVHNSLFGKAYATAYGIPNWLDFPSDTSLMGNRGIDECTDSDVNNDVL